MSVWGTSCRRDSHCQLLACSPVGNNGEDPQGQNPPWDQLLSQAMLLCASLGLPVPRTGNELPNSRRKCPRAGISREDSPAASPPQLCCTLTSCLLCKHGAGSSSPLPNSLAMRWSQLLPAILAKETKPLQRCPYSGALPACRGQGCSQLSGESHTWLPWGQWDPVPVTLPVTASASWMSGHHCLTRPTVPVGLSNPNTLFFKGLTDLVPSSPSPADPKCRVTQEPPRQCVPATWKSFSMSWPPSTQLRTSLPSLIHLVSALGRKALAAGPGGCQHSDLRHCRAPSSGLAQPASLGAEIWPNPDLGKQPCNPRRLLRASAERNANRSRPSPLDSFPYPGNHGPGNMPWCSWPPRSAVIPPASQSRPATKVPLRSPQPMGDNNSPSPEAAEQGGFAGSDLAHSSALPTLHFLRLWPS